MGDLAPYAGVIKVGLYVLGGAGVLGFVVWVVKRIGSGAVARDDVKESQTREEHHDAAEEELAKPPPTGADEILDARERRRRRHGGE